jgi:hypothetical protein
MVVVVVVGARSSVWILFCSTLLLMALFTTAFSILRKKSALLYNTVSIIPALVLGPNNIS